MNQSKLYNITNDQVLKRPFANSYESGFTNPMMILLIYHIYLIPYNLKIYKNLNTYFRINVPQCTKGY